MKEALGYAAYITCTTFLPNAVNVVTLFYGAPPHDIMKLSHCVARSLTCMCPYCSCVEMCVIVQYRICRWELGAG